MADQSSQDGATKKKKQKMKRDDFSFGEVLGEGAYARVYHCARKSDGKDFAAKVVDKQFVLRHNKVHEMQNERTVLSMLDHRSIVRLYFTFQDAFYLYYILELASNGELFHLISRLGKFPGDLTLFYMAELVDVVEYLHKRNIIHRDLKPENILLADDWHVKLTDFATSKKIIDPKQKRKNSFVGTAEYVSPEILDGKQASFSSDLWALGCVLFQMVTGSPPFRGESEYLTFQKVLRCEYTIPESVTDPNVRDLIGKLLVLDPDGRLGCKELGGFEALKAHPFFKPVDWEHLKEMQVPKFHLPDSQGDEVDEDQLIPEAEEKTDRKKQMYQEPKSSIWRNFLVDKEEIVFCGLISKRRGLLARKRQLILTNFPRMLYVNPQTLELRGEIPWSPELKVDRKNEKVFWVHTPKRSYYIQGLTRTAVEWEEAIARVFEEKYHKPMQKGP